MTGFRDDLLDRSDGMDNCLLCDKPTNSHLVLLKYDEENNRIRRADDLEDSDAFGHVCHTCAGDRGMNADAIVAEYHGWISGLLSDHDVPLSDFVQRPGEVADEYDLPEP